MSPNYTTSELNNNSGIVKYSYMIRLKVSQNCSNIEIRDSIMNR